MTENIALFIAGIAIALAGWALLQVHKLAVEVAVLGRDDKHAGRSIDQLRQEMREMRGEIIARLERIEARNGEPGR